MRGSAASFLIAAAARRGSRVLVHVLPDGESASKHAEDARFYLGYGSERENPLEDEIILYPSSDAQPYATDVFDTDVSVGRISTLYRLCEAGSPRVLTVSLDSLLRKVVPRSDFRRTSFLLRVGEEVDREDLLASLVTAGYRRAPLVEEPGDFSVRGFIVDIYPPCYSYPLRVEQMDDSIESIRFFDPATQRSKEDIQEIQIGPMHMLIPDDISMEEGLARIRDECDERGIEKRIRQRITEDLRNGVRFPGCESYLPYFFNDLESLLDYLPRDATILLPDANILQITLEDINEEILRGWEEAAKDGLPVPHPDRLFFSKEELFARLRRFRTVTLGLLELENPDHTSIRVQCESNEDVRPELTRARSYDSGMNVLVDRMNAWRDDGVEVILTSRTRGQAERLLKLLEPYPMRLDFRGEGFETSNLTTDPTPGVRLYIGGLSAGFRAEKARRVIVTEEEIFGARVKSSRRKRAYGGLVSSLTDLSEGEAVVHEDYGIGVFRGLEKREFDGVCSEVMVIEYAGGDLLYHPLERLQVIQKYVSGAEEPPRVDRLGGKGWINAKAKVTKSVREMAKELLEIYARRHVSTRPAYSISEDILAAFEASFGFEETPDQARAIEEIMESMDSDRPMDRLVCGDVGFGKTEVALRAAFRAAMDCKQVAILVPTTVLAQQHYETTIKRFNGYPIRVEVLSRFRSPSDQKSVIQELKEGKVDVVIGTHKLLGKDVGFKNLGLLVVDEEQRFGVTHKEKIKKYRTQVDVLTLTATPIPRTLNLSLTGIRDLSIIETAPANRRSIRTHVMKQSEEVIRDALLREIGRGGQAFYLHNRVRSIHKRAAALQRLVPEGVFGVAHGQMSERELERVMLEFVTGKFNVLVCTSIIESGLDIPRANTIVIERADTFGLADLYQLRGRVGRSSVRAHAYLLTPPESQMTPEAVKRLAVIQEHSTLGQGFRIAMRDLEIRGAGNILGSSQSGHVNRVGYEMYVDLLEQAVKEIKGERALPKIDPDIRLRMETLIPEEYVPDPQQRMSLYKRLSRAEESQEIDDVQDEMLDLYGRPTEEAVNLIETMRIRLVMKELRITKLDYNGKELALSFDTETPISPGSLIAWADRNKDKVRLVPGDRVAVAIGDVAPKERIRSSMKLMADLNQIADNDSSEDSTVYPGAAEAVIGR